MQPGNSCHDSKDDPLFNYPNLLKKLLAEILSGRKIEMSDVSKLGKDTPTGEELLDSAALKIVRTAARKFPRIPATITRDRLSYVVPIVFKKKKPRKK